MSAKRTVVVKALVLQVSWSELLTIGAFVVRAVDMKMPCGMAVKTYSLWSRAIDGPRWGVLRCNSSGVGCSTVLMKGRARISGVVDEGGSDGQWGRSRSLKAHSSWHRGSRNRQSRGW